jgi:hypothetical protein
MPGYDMARNDPFAAVAARQKKVEQLAKTASVASGTATFQSIQKILAAQAELEDHAAELAGHTTELGQHETSLENLLSRLTNASQVASDSFFGYRGDRWTGDSVPTAWWEGAKPTATVTSMSGRFELVVGGQCTALSDPGDGLGEIATLSFSGDGGDRGGDDRRIATYNSVPIERTFIISKPENTTLTLHLEWQARLATGWIILRPLF